MINKLARIGGKTLHVPTLALGVDRVHRHGTFTAAAGAAEYRHLVALNIGIDGSQIVLLGTAYLDRLREVRLVGFLFRGLGDFRARSHRFFQRPAGVGFFAIGNLFGRSGTDYPSATTSTLWANVDDPVGCFDYV